MQTIQIFNLYQDSKTPKTKCKHIHHLIDWLIKTNTKINETSQIIDNNQKINLLVDLFSLFDDQKSIELCCLIFDNIHDLFFMCMDQFRQNQNRKMTHTHFGNLFRENVLCDLFYMHVLFEFQEMSNKRYLRGSSMNYCVTKQILDWFDDMQNSYKEQVTYWNSHDQKYHFKNYEWALYRCFFCILIRFISCSVMKHKLQKEKKKVLVWNEFADRCHFILCFISKICGSKDICNQIKFFID